MTIAKYISELPRASWRGIEFPYTARESSWAHDNPKHRLQFRERQIVDTQGPQNPTFSYTIPGYATIRWPSSLPDTVIPELWNAARDKSSGRLVDPVWGVIQCVPVSWSDSLAASPGDGLDVTLVLEQSDDDLAELVAAVRDTGPVEALVAKAFDSWPDDVKKPPGDSILGIFSAIGGFVAQVEGTVGVLRGPIDRLIRDFTDLEKQLGVSRKPESAESRAALREALLALHMLRAGRARKRGATRPVLSAVNVVAMPAFALASKHGMEFRRFADLNPDLATETTVAAGTRYLYDA